MNETEKKLESQVPPLEFPEIERISCVRSSLKTETDSLTLKQKTIGNEESILFFTNLNSKKKENYF